MLTVEAPLRFPHHPSRVIGWGRLLEASGNTGSRLRLGGSTTYAGLFGDPGAVCPFFSEA